MYHKVNQMEPEAHEQKQQNLLTGTNAKQSLEKFLLQALDKVEALSESHISFYHFVESDQTTISLQQWSTKTMNQFCQAGGRGKHYSVDRAGVWVDCVHQKKPVIHNNYASLPHRKGMPEGHAAVIRELVVPVMRDGKVMALLGVGNKSEDYTPADVDIVSYFADVTWEIVQKKRLDEDMVLQLAIEEAMASLASLLLTTTDMEDISDKVLDAAKHLTRSRYGFVGSIDPGTGHFISHAMTWDIWDDCQMADKSIAVEKCSGLWRWILDNKEPLLVNDFQNDRRFGTLSLDHIALDAFLGAPAMIGDRIVGLIALANPENSFLDIDLTITKRLATLFSLAVERQCHEKTMVDSTAKKAEELEQLVRHQTRELDTSRTMLEKIFNSQQDAIFEAVEKSEFRFRELFNNIGSGIAVYDSPDDGQGFFFKDFNRSGERITKIRKQDVIGREVREVFPGIVDTGLFHVFRRVWQTGITEHYPQALYTDNMLEIWIENQVFKLPSGELVALFDDVTDHKKALEKLAISEQRLKLSLESVRDAVWDLRLEPEEVYFSSRWYTMLGYAPNEFPASYETWLDLVHPDDRTYAEQAVNTHLKDGSPFEIEFRMRTRDNKWRWILSRGKTVEKDDHGKSIRMVGTHMDLTKRKAMEVRLRQSQKMEAMGVLAGGIAHDFNNILSAVIGYAELVMEAVPEDSKAFERLKGILLAGERARALISQILTFSRKSDQDLQLMDVLPVVKEALGFMRASLPSTISMEENIRPDLPNIMGDPTQIHQVIINLTTNAAHAMKQGGILSVRVDSVDLDSDFIKHDPAFSPGHYIQLTVSDTGCGIHPDILSNIFDPFFTTKEKGHGTGLGLSTVHGIVREYGGHILVDSKPGAGTTVDVFFPAIQSTNSVAAEEQPVMPVGNERVLVVDDEEVLSIIVQDMLENLGYSVVSLTSSKDALSLFANDPKKFDIILSDITMPGIGGVQLVRECHRIKPDIPVILWSGSSSLISDDTARDLGVSTLLKKPFLQMDLARAIRKALDKTFLKKY